MVPIGTRMDRENGAKKSHSFSDAFRTALLANMPVEICTRLANLETRRSLNYTDIEGNTPLAIAVSNYNKRGTEEQVALIKVLVESGASVNRIVKKQTLFSLAASANASFTVIEKLFELGLKLELEDVMVALTWKNIDIVHLVLDNLPKDALRIVVPSALIVCASNLLSFGKTNRYYVLIKKIIDDQGVDINFKTSEFTFLHLLIHFSHHLDTDRIICYLLRKSKVDFNIFIENKGIPFEYAMTLCKFDIAERIKDRSDLSLKSCFILRKPTTQFLRPDLF